MRLILVLLVLAFVGLGSLVSASGFPEHLMDPTPASLVGMNPSIPTPYYKGGVITIEPGPIVGWICAKGEWVFCGPLSTTR